MQHPDQASKCVALNAGIRYLLCMCICQSDYAYHLCLWQSHPRHAVQNYHTLWGCKNPAATGIFKFYDWCLTPKLLMSSRNPTRKQVSSPDPDPDPDPAPAPAPYTPVATKMGNSGCHHLLALLQHRPPSIHQLPRLYICRKASLELYNKHVGEHTSTHREMNDLSARKPNQV